MTDLQPYATIRDTAQKLRKMVREASGGYHDDVYLRVLGSEDTVQFVTQSDGQSVMSYCTFSDLKLVEGDAEAIIPVGLDNDTKGFLDYLGIAEGSGNVEMTLLGPEDGRDSDDHPRLATHWKAEGALETTIRLPGSESDLKKVPWLLPKRFTEGNGYISSSAFEDGELAVDDPREYTPPTVIETTVDTVRDSIIEPADFMDDQSVEYYPIIVADGELTLNLQGEDGDDAIAGTLNAEAIVGPDVNRRFQQGFSEVFNELSGPVRLSTAPDTDEGQPSPPLVVVQDDISGHTVRHILGPSVKA
jgi:hypothetical protein